MIRIAMLIAALAAADPAGDGDATAEDLKRMQGDWMVASMVSNGFKEPIEESQSLFRTVEGTRYAVSRYSKVIGQGTFRIDATQTPKTIDSTPVGKSGPVPPILGIYEFDGEKLRICNAAPGKPRPTSLTSKLGSQHTLIEWQIEKN
jgi:uncharacterized protein (TIGR03067 family)